MDVIMATVNDDHDTGLAEARTQVHYTQSCISASISCTNILLYLKQTHTFVLNINVKH